MTGDEGVMSTNDDATTCKRSAVASGYWEDPFVECFAKGSLVKKAPEINRGYYGRVSAINHLIQQFIELTKRKGSDCQIVNIGCGFDTLFWRLKALYKVANIKSFVDIDLDGVTMRKVQSIRHKPNLLSLLGDDIRISSTELHSSHYHLITADVRRLDTVDTREHFSQKLFNQCGLDKNLPTLFISECVLVYLHVPDSSGLLTWITGNFEHCYFINYEQVNMLDRFGEIMLESLHQRQCELFGVNACTDLESQRQRFLKTGWTTAVAWDMNRIYKNFLPRAEVERIEKLEFFDEHDLLEQLLSHYCIVVASKQNGHNSDAIGFE
ncbi:Leucine carboxyl methyltransferase 1 [Halotydeus destructor]|nr:Leucine carboxyl methyltransferase 1 [Halotydeus destructor]